MLWTSVVAMIFADHRWVGGISMMNDGRHDWGGSQRVILPM
jgi:hypothetical protein